MTRQCLRFADHRTRANVERSEREQKEQRMPRLIAEGINEDTFNYLKKQTSPTLRDNEDYAQNETVRNRGFSPDLEAFVRRTRSSRLFPSCAT